jgi:hypothetical protein
VAFNSEIGTVRFSVGAVYDRPICRSCRTVGGHRPPLQKTEWCPWGEHMALVLFTFLRLEPDATPAFRIDGTPMTEPTTVVLLVPALADLFMWSRRSRALIDSN